VYFSGVSSSLNRSSIFFVSFRQSKEDSIAPKKRTDSYLGSRDLPAAVTHLSEELTTKSPNEKETDVGLLEKALLSKDDFLRNGCRDL
jgi:hypothetical protein